VAPLVIYKRFVMASWSEFAEIFGIPFRYGKTSILDPARKTNMIEMLADMGSAAYAVLDTADEVEFLQTNRPDAFKVFDEYIDRLNGEMSKAILGQTGTTDEKSFTGAANVHKSILDSILAAEITDCQDWVNEQVIPKLIRIGVIKEGSVFVNVQPAQPKEAMNGAQSTAMVEIARSVYLGEVTKDSAVEMFKIAYNLSDEEASRMVDPMEVGKFADRSPEAIMRRVAMSYNQD